MKLTGRLEKMARLWIIQSMFGIMTSVITISLTFILMSRQGLFRMQLNIGGESDTKIPLLEALGQRGVMRPIFIPHWQVLLVLTKS